MKASIKTIIIALIVMLPFIAAAQTNPAAEGKVFFLKRCKMCHGKDGTRGFLGAANLQTSHLDDNALIAVITNGRKVMPSWSEKFTPEQIGKIAAYVKTLRTPEEK